MDNRPIAVVRRDLIASTGPAIYGVKRLDKVRSPKGEIFTFLGVRDGVAHVEREDKTKGKPFEEVDTGEFSSWRTI